MYIYVETRSNYVAYKVHFDRLKLVKRFEKEATKEEVLSVVLSNGVIKANLKQMLFNSRKKRRRMSRGLFIQLLGYQIVAWKFWVITIVEKT